MIVKILVKITYKSYQEGLTKLIKKDFPSLLSKTLIA